MPFRSEDAARGIADGVALDCNGIAVGEAGEARVVLVRSTIKRVFAHRDLVDAVLPVAHGREEDDPSFLCHAVRGLGHRHGVAGNVSRVKDIGAVGNEVDGADGIHIKRTVCLFLIDAPQVERVASDGDGRAVINADGIRLPVLVCLSGGLLRTPNAAGNRERAADNFQVLDLVGMNAVFDSHSRLAL